MANRITVASTILALLLSTTVAAPGQTGKQPGTIEIVLSQDIRNPDRYLDELIAKTKNDPTAIALLQTIKTLEHDAKVKWLLGLPARPPSAAYGKSPLVCLLVAVLIVELVIVAYLKPNGESAFRYEQRKRTEEIQRCEGTPVSSGTTSGN